MKNIKWPETFLVVTLSIIWLCQPIIYEMVVHNQYNGSQHEIKRLLTLSGGAQKSPNKSSGYRKKKSLLQKSLLQQFFPDDPERIKFEMSQRKFYDSGRKKIKTFKRIYGPLLMSPRITNSLTLLPEEQNAMDYFSGTGVYKKYQSLETPPNKFDTRRSFIRKISQNSEVRRKFLTDYNRKQQKLKEVEKYITD